MSLFATDTRPLADRIRPAGLDDVVGQDHLLGPGGPLRRMVDEGRLSSLILWGPPGCGKTTLARLLAPKDQRFVTLSALAAGVADLRKVFDEARRARELGQPTVLFIDEIHRFNRAQQDAFLPVVEDGTITLIGATTENPSFELNAALLSRCPVFVLNRLDHGALNGLIARAEALFAKPLPLTEEARGALPALADGDGRYLLNLVEAVFRSAPKAPLDTAGLARLINKRAPVYDKSQESHYNLISALHKSVRGSDADAALYWLARMLAGGEDPHFVARRLVRMAVEDIGLAEPNALPVCIAAWQAYERLGSPEGELALAQACLYLATAPKSNAAYVAMKSAQALANETGSAMPPAHILNAPTKLMKNLGYGAGYQYDPDAPEGFSGANYFPDGVARRELYQPVERGFEREIRKRLDWWGKLRAQRQADG